MISLLHEIASLRGGEPIDIDRKNNNRHCVLSREKDGTKTAYCFSTPVYNTRSRKVVNFLFEKKDRVGYTVGSNANITVAKSVFLENDDGFCRVVLNKIPGFIFPREIQYGKDSLFPTLNGIMYKAFVQKEKAISFEIEVSSPYAEILANNKFFSWMREPFKPFVTVSCIGAADGKGQIIAPAILSHKRIGERKYELTVTSCSPLGDYVLFEINLYEQKLFQDTTVESANPKTNNVFGGTAFVGHTSAFGEQWLYARPELSRLFDLMDKHIHKAVLHLPKLNDANVPMQAYELSSRFCSFGSNWENKKMPATMSGISMDVGHYQCVDVTRFMVDARTNRFTSTQGWILKTKNKNSGFTVLATADSYYMPQILEINYN